MVDRSVIGGQESAEEWSHLDGGYVLQRNRTHYGFHKRRKDYEGIKKDSVQENGEKRRGTNFRNEDFTTWVIKVIHSLLVALFTNIK
jgi:hypothetical protein